MANFIALNVAAKAERNNTKQWTK